MKLTIDTKDYIPRLLSTIGLTTQGTADTRAHRAYEAGHYDGGEDEPPSGDIATFGYRRVTTNTLRDFTKLSHDQLIDIVWTVYQSNPMAKRVLQIIRDFVLGRGVQVQTDDDSLKEIVDDFWQRLGFDRLLKKMVLQKHLWGEQCFPAFVRESDGAVRLGYIDPGAIEAVIPHPHNAMEPWAVVLKKDVAATQAKIYRIIRKDEGHADGDMMVQSSEPDKLLLASQTNLEPWELAFLSGKELTEYTGDCFYFSINNVSNQPRGFSTLLQVIDFLDAFDETLFALAEREQFAGYFSWDVTLAGASGDEVSERAGKIRRNPPKRGSVNVHNDAELWDMQKPDLKQAGSVETLTALENHILGGLGIPRHWYAHGDGTNRATAQEQGGPTFRTMEMWQDDIRDDIMEILQFVADQAEIAGDWRPKADGSDITIIMPEMVKRDVIAATTTLQHTVSSLAVARNELKVISRETASKALAKIMAELGIEYDPIKELKLVDAELPDEPEPEQPAKVIIPALNGNSNGLQPADMEALRLPTVTRWRKAGMSEHEIEQTKKDALLEDEYGVREPFEVEQ